jgi:predicted ATPase
MQQKDNYIILTGAPGVGKTTLITKLRERGVFCVDEAARKIIAEQRLIDGEGVPEKNPELFSKLLLSRSIQLYKDYLDRKDIVVFDRGVADSYAYAKLFGLDTKVFENTARKYLSNKNIFIISPWKDIYRNDDERKMSFYDSEMFHKYFIEIYRKLDCNLVEVPCVSTEERYEFVISKMRIQKLTLVDSSVKSK